MTIKTYARRTAAETRAAHIAAAKRDLDRLTRAVATLKANTRSIPADSWEWEGDWAAIAHKIAEVADQAESTARISSDRRA